MLKEEAPTKRRRERGSGSLYQIGRIRWIAYKHPDGTRRAESTSSSRKGDAVRLLRRRVGARDHGLPVIPNVEKVTFEQAAQAVIDDFKNTGKKSLDDVERRIRLHLTPFFGGRRLISIMADDVRRYVTKRKADTIGSALVNRPVSNGEINRELQILKRIFSLAVKDGKLATRPHIAMLIENNVRQGFFEPHHYESLLKHLPAPLRPVVEFAYITGWRIASELLPLEWRQIDFDAGEVRLGAGTTKNREGRVFPMTADLRAVLRAQAIEHERLQKAGQVEPWVFFRMVAKGRGGPLQPKPILSINKAWKAACIAAGCPGRIPHDFRRTAVRNLVRAGISQTVAMRMTGHKTDSVFRRYDIVSPGDLRDAARKLDALPVNYSTASS